MRKSIKKFIGKISHFRPINSQIGISDLLRVKM